MTSSTSPFPPGRKPQRDTIYEEMLGKFADLSLPKLDDVYADQCKEFSKLDPRADQDAIKYEVEKDLCASYLPERFADIFPNEIPTDGPSADLGEKMDTGDNSGPKLFSEAEMSVRSSRYQEKMELKAKMEKLKTEIAESSVVLQRSKEVRERWGENEKQKNGKKDNCLKVKKSRKKHARAWHKAAGDAARWVAAEQEAKPPKDNGTIDSSVDTLPVPKSTWKWPDWV